MNKITIRKPFDAHLHLRDGDLMKAVLPYSARQFWGGIIMPNLVPPVTKVSEAQAYLLRILRGMEKCRSFFKPFPALYLTDDTLPDEIDRMRNETGYMRAVKYYPAHGTTNSALAVTDIRKLGPVLERMEKRRVVLCLHGEVTDPEVDIFDREAVFIDTTLRWLRKSFPGLKMVLEHITTMEAVDYLLGEQDSNLAGSITAHHLVANRNHMLADGMKSHYYCKPLLKKAEHQKALRRAATSGNLPFFLGTDSAPHAVDAKECAVCAAGAFTAPIALELYCEVFAEERALDKFEAFASIRGPEFYGLKPSTDTITLVREEWFVDEMVAIHPLVGSPGREIKGADLIKPLFYGEKRPLHWRVTQQEG